ncbi:Ada metal-binding domain-containing protein [Kaistia soli]|uniref:Ada metal-binding domain-containing protein n=1 Tax=Kaistia soli TaxID=446684 RepID=UPI0009FD6DAC|nr:Ada metal-binding domain-containing protein [Kaistia soli]
MSTSVPFPAEARFYGVMTTKIFCRPDCPSRPPRPENVRFFADAAAAKAAGLRACKRCSPGREP